MTTVSLFVRFCLSNAKKYCHAELVDKAKSRSEARTIEPVCVSTASHASAVYYPSSYLKQNIKKYYKNFKKKELFLKNLRTIIMWGHVPGVSRVQEIVRKKEKVKNERKKRIKNA